MIEYIRIKNSEVHPMKYVYVEFADETLVTFNDIRRDNNGEHIDVYFERPTEDGFAFLQIKISAVVFQAVLSVNINFALGAENFGELLQLSGDVFRTKTSGIALQSVLKNRRFVFLR